VASFGEDTRAEIDEIVGMLTANLEKIAEHGPRADGIVAAGRGEAFEHGRGRRAGDPQSRHIARG
jgi:hypothetical protein